jgi:hypothetical protein
MAIFKHERASSTSATTPLKEAKGAVGNPHLLAHQERGLHRIVPRRIVLKLPDNHLAYHVPNSFV